MPMNRVSRDQHEDADSVRATFRKINLMKTFSSFGRLVATLLAVVAGLTCALAAGALTPSAKADEPPSNCRLEAGDVYLYGECMANEYKISDAGVVNDCDPTILGLYVSCMGIIIAGIEIDDAGARFDDCVHGVRAACWDETPDFHFNIARKKTRKLPAWVCEGDRPGVYDAWSGKRNYPYPGRALRIVAAKRRITNTTRKTLTVYVWCNDR